MTEEQKHALGQGINYMIGRTNINKRAIDASDDSFMINLMLLENIDIENNINILCKMIGREEI